MFRLIKQVLRGVTREMVVRHFLGPLRPLWEVQPGMARCLKRALAAPFCTHIVSVNWSQDVVASVLRRGLSPGLRLAKDLIFLSLSDVHAADH